MAINSYVTNDPVTGARVMGGDAPPTAAVGRSFGVGDRIKNTSRGSGEPAEWVCTVGGDPGTWESSGGSLASIVIGPLSAANVSMAVPVPAGLRAKAVNAVYSVAGGSGAAAMVELLTGTTAPGSGTDQLSAAIALTGTANTVLPGTLIASPGTTAAGGRIGVKLSGTLTGLVNLFVTIEVERVG